MKSELNKFKNIVYWEESDAHRIIGNLLTLLDKDWEEYQLEFFKLIPPFELFGLLFKAEGLDYSLNIIEDRIFDYLATKVSPEKLAELITISEDIVQNC